MARPLRVEFDQAVYHVTARGNQRQSIFLDDKDRIRFLETLAEAVQRFGVIVHAYCLMPNHHHLLLQTPRANLSRTMAWLQTTYTIRFNHRHRRDGHLFQGRFKAQVVEADEYARELIEYIHLNPVRPHDRRKAIPPDRREELDRWTFSSHRVYAGLDSPPPWLCTEWLSYFGDTMAAARRSYRRSIDQRFGQSFTNPWTNLRHGLILGGEGFADRISTLIQKRTDPESIRWTQADTAAKLPATLARAIKTEKDWQIQLWLRIKLGGESSSAIARELGYADCSGVHRVIARLEQKAKADPKLAKKLETLKIAILSNVDGVLPKSRLDLRNQWHLIK
jgi:REP element-mobilizing transposase RayT